MSLARLKSLNPRELEQLAERPGSEGSFARAEIERRRQVRVNLTPGQGAVARAARRREEHEARVNSNLGKGTTDKPEPVKRVRKPKEQPSEPTATPQADGE